MIRKLRFAVLGIFASLALVGCASLSEFAGQDVTLVNPAPSEASLEQSAYAYGLAFDAAQDSVADLIANPDTPDVVAQYLGEATVAVEPLVQTMLTAFREYSQVRAEMQVREEAGLPESAELVQNTVSALLAAQRAYEEARPEVESFLALVEGLTG